MPDDIDRVEDPEDADPEPEFDPAELIQQVPEPYRNQILALLFQNNVPGHVPPETAKHAADAYKHTSENERKRAQNDAHWVVYRVWAVDRDRSFENLGNVVSGQGEQWALSPESWRVRPVRM